MSQVEVRQTLAELQLNQQEAAKLLGVSPRSVRRWLEGEAIPGPAEGALRAWRQLEARGLAWRPDSVTLYEADREQIAVYRQDAMNLNALLERVSSRGGPRLPWKVNVIEGSATMEWAYLSFYKLQNGGFSPSVYRRSDQDSPPDLHRDRDLIDDALYCIAIEFQKLKRRADALRAVADNIRTNSPHAGTVGAKMLDDAAKQMRQRSIEGHAERLELLAAQTEAGDKTNYQQFEKIRTGLARLGLWADRGLVSVVARSFFEGVPKVRLIFMREGRLDNAITWSKELPAETVQDLLKGHKLHFMGDKLRPINSPSHELSDPTHVVIHVPIEAEFDSIQGPGYFVVADLNPSQLRLERYT